jgi:probable HAF family extracellular repeat protein
VAPDKSQHAVVWTPNASGPSSTIELGALPGGSLASANGINAAGQVVGISDRSDRTIHAVIWSPTASGSFSAADLGTLPGGSMSEAYAISPAGQVVGASDSGSSNKSQHAVVWTTTG